MENRIIVISVGGSLLVPGEIDIQFITNLRKFVLSYLQEGMRFILVTGGGSVCRTYQHAANELGVNNKESLDWVGIMVTRLNAELIRVVFGSAANSEVLYDCNKKTNGNLIIAAGHLPGCSTDYDAVVLAETYNASLLINLFNQDYVYDKDPREYADAIPLPSIKWSDYLAMVGKKWMPGSHTPFDPIAAQKAKKLGLKVILANGNNFENLDNIIMNKRFVGTVLQ